MQVEVRDVSPEVAEACVAEQRVEVRPVDVDLPARRVHGIRDGADLVLIHAVRGGIGDHQGRQLGRVLGDLGVQIVEVDVAEFVARDHDHLHARQHGAGGVGAVRTGRDQADGAVQVATGPVVAADRQQAGEFALASGVGLQRHRVIAGDLGEPGLQVRDHDEVALDIRGRGEGVDVRELGPGDRRHLGGGGQLHGAGAERDHAAVERIVLVCQVLQVAHHRGLAVVRGEDRVGEEVARPTQRAGDRRVCRRRSAAEPEHGIQVDLDLRQRPAGGAFRAHLVETERDAVPVHLVHQDAALPRRRDELCRARRNVHRHGVEEVAVLDADAGRAELGRVARRLLRDLARDPGQAAGAVIDGVHGCHHRQQHLRGTDIARRLLAPDVLFARLQREAVRGIAVGVLRDANQAARQLSLEPRPHRHVAGVRTAEAHRNAEALGCSDRDVGTELARGRDQGQRQQVSGNDRQATARVHGFHDRRRVPEVAGCARVLDRDAEALRNLGRLDQRKAKLDEFDANGLRTAAQQRLRLGEQVRVDDEHIRGRSGGTTSEQHPLDHRGALIEHRRVRRVHTGQIGDHGLEVDERLEAAL